MRLASTLLSVMAETSEEELKTKDKMQVKIIGFLQRAIIHLGYSLHFRWPDLISDSCACMIRQKIQFILPGRTLSYVKGTSQRLDKDSLQDAPASLQACQENKVAK